MNRFEDLAKSYDGNTYVAYNGRICLARNCHLGGYILVSDVSTLDTDLRTIRITAVGQALKWRESPVAALGTSVKVVAAYQYLADQSHFVFVTEAGGQCSLWFAPSAFNGILKTPPVESVNPVAVVNKVEAEYPLAPTASVTH